MQGTISLFIVMGYSFGEITIVALGLCIQSILHAKGEAVLSLFQLVD
jgi:hypothetical protein